jgi:DNA-directed RNA polymerase specialized sigma24 family protein
MQGRPRCTPEPHGSDRSADDQQWIEGLSGTGAPHERTCEELHEILFRAARREARQRGRGLRVAGPDLDDLACQAASDALLLVIRKVADFRGESRFTTWATRFVVYQVIAKLDQHVRRRRSSASLPPEVWRNFLRHTRAPTSRPRHSISPEWSGTGWMRASPPGSARCFSVWHGGLHRPLWPASWN